MFSDYGKTSKVSIHTPTKGVTFFSGDAEILFSVSIHTPTKGVTSPFDSTDKAVIVSIHTPTKGVTFCNYQIC